MPAGGDGPPERSIKTRSTLKLENGADRPYPVPRNVVNIGLGLLALSREEREALQAQATSKAPAEAQTDSGAPVAQEKASMGRVVLTSLAVPTPDAVLQNHPNAPHSTRYVAVSHSTSVAQQA